MDPKSPINFIGVDFTAFLQGPAVYDGKAVGDHVMDLIEQYLTEFGFSCRRCFYAGRGATSGGPEFFEVLLWVQDHWEFLAGAASVVLARVAKIRHKWRQLKRLWEQRVLNPYRPSVIVELAARTQDDGAGLSDDEASSFRALLSRVPDISQRLRREMPDQTFTFRVQAIGPVSATASASFKVSEVRPSDAVKMVRFMDKCTDQTDLVVTLYRKFGLITRLEQEKISNYMGSMNK
ncbi:hypothetical protein AS031_12140 [Pseudarthrobacter enclensis]|uniref:Uncharacterized protein n=1 Tax=Pseudarthrobacter enclensis TaxID=993070 RepID=A0A0V8IMY0_9MICC|nr:hypothetical protein AS031_12140 [Pseudarthrobacter enclensis]